MFFAPCFDPVDDAFNVGLQIIHALALELNDDFFGIRGTRFVEDDLHYLGLVIFLYFFQRVCAAGRDRSVIIARGSG